MKKILSLLCLLTTLSAYADVTLTSSNLPIVIINTNGQTIPDDPKIDATMGIINNAPGMRNNVTDAYNEYSGNIGIEVRGQSSQMFPMKSYSIELRDAAGDNNDTPLFGMPEESDWVLYAPYTDKTLMRNFLAYTMSNGLGHWAAHCRYVEVVLNGEYVGIYVLMEKIKRGSGRVDVPKLSSSATTGDALTGGYIFSIDKDPDFWYSSYPPPNTSGADIRFSYVYPKPADITTEQKDYIKSYVDSFENALAGPDFQDPLTGFRKYADEMSFIDYFIVNEISRNVDGYRISTYLHKSKNSIDQRIKAGPVWDYDIAFRNANYCNGSDVQGWAYNFNYVCSDYYSVPFWWERLMSDTTFQRNLSCRWQQQRQSTLSITSISHIIDSVYTLLGEAQQRHFSKWPILGQYVWPNPWPIPNTYDEEINTLKTWIADRADWMDNSLPQTGNCSGALPVHLLSFSVARAENDARLVWQTASESNSSHFVLERSTDAVHFTRIATIQAAGSSSQPLTYRYTDAGVTKLNVSKIYYRLQMADKDGTVKTSDVQTLNLGGSPFTVQAYPNPVVGDLQLTITGTREQPIQVVIISSDGKRVVQGRRNLTAGSNRLYYNTASWSKGVYLIKVFLPDGTTRTASVVK